MKWFIYVLRDPVTMDVRYVGKTSNPKSRLRGHIGSARDPKGPRHHVVNWIISLIRNGHLPIMEVIDAGQGGGYEAAEVAWIAEYRRRGARLTNITKGGNGAPAPRSPETIAKMRAAATARLQSPETVEKRVASLRGKKRPPHIVAALRLVNLGRVHTPETRARMSASKTGSKRTAESVAKTIAGNLGQKRSAEQCARISAAKVGKAQSRETKAKISAALTGRSLVSEITREKLCAAQRARRAKEKETRDNGERKEEDPGGREA